MMRRLLTLALLLPSCLLACGSGTGDIPGPGCTSVQTETPLAFPDSTAAKHGDTLECSTRSPTIAANGKADCLALLGTSAAACSCPADQGLQDVTADHKNAAAVLFKSSGSAVPSCVCEIKQITGDDAAGLAACLQETMDPVVDASMKPVNGYCFVADANPKANPQLLADCPADQKQGLRFVGRPATHEATDVAAVVVCSTEQCATPGE
jgi:hypothetical protein